MEHINLYASLVMVLVPSITTAITGVLKKLPSLVELSDSSRTPAVRLLAAAISLAVVLLTEWSAGAFDANIISVALQTVLLTFGTWVASLGIFHGLFQKK